MKEIFIVEDDQDIRELLEYLLISRSYSVKAFGNVATFNQELKKGNPHLILLDIMLPDGNGQVVCQELGEKEETQEVPVVLMSAHVESNKINCAHAKDFLAKPFNIEHLFTKIQKWTDYGNEQAATSP